MIGLRKKEAATCSVNGAAAASIKLVQNYILTQNTLNPMLRRIIRYFAILTGVELLLFIGLIVTTMTDEKAPAISQLFYWPLKHILGFPLVLINQDYPFFLDGGGAGIAVIFLGMLNNLILAGALLGMCNIASRLLKTERQNK